MRLCELTPKTGNKHSTRTFGIHPGHRVVTVYDNGVMACTCGATNRIHKCDEIKVVEEYLRR